MSFEVFQDGHNGGHLGYGNRTILAILNLYNSPKPPIKFQLNLTYCLGLDSESLCHCDASHQVLAQSNFQFGRRCRLKNFKMATMAAILDIGTEQS